MSNISLTKSDFIFARRKKERKKERKVPVGRSYIVGLASRERRSGGGGFPRRVKRLRDRQVSPGLAIFQGGCFIIGTEP